MGKVVWRPGNMIYPVPAVLVTCGQFPQSSNVLTVAWTGTICSDPAMCYISVRPSRFSHQLIMQTGEFVINLTNEQLAKATDWCGVKSGRDVNKFEAMGITPIAATTVSAPMIKESPMCIECKVVDVKKLGSHDMFIANVVAVNADEDLIDQTGKFDLEKAKLIAYSHGQYYKLGQRIGKFGWTVEKKKK
ncbi:MAG: flavin reductase family protein [Salinivirgaceae bacterium]|nr:flavin reductase family protein [Salinivirgaceae bacterium]